jgi:hypothetical protein
MASMAQTSQAGTTSARSVEEQARAWMDDPHAYFGYSTTRLHSVPRAQMEAVQLAAMNLRLAERRGQIAVLAKLADAQDIDRVDTLDAMAPLLLPHDIYKSYPISLLAKQRFDQIAKWLDRLTVHDVTQVDTDGCASIDDWLMRIQAATPLDVATSSGSSGTCSFYPKSKRDYLISMTGLRIDLLQRFGVEPTDADLHEKIHVVSPGYRDGHATSGRGHHYTKQVFCGDDESFLHCAFNFKISSDLMWLAGRLRAAAAAGDASRVDVPPALLARRAEWEAVQKDMPAQQAAFIQQVTAQLKGERVAAMGLTNMFYTVAKKGLADGIIADFAPGSVVMGGGGGKGVALADDAETVICQFFGVDRMLSAYGMTEINCHSVLCEHDRYHVPPMVTPYLLDIDSGQPLPRSGVQTGRYAFFDMTHQSAWGGLITGDMATIDWDTPCPCGRTSYGLEKQIGRVSDFLGGEDKISCAATPSAQAEAMDYLTAIEA